MTHGNRFGPFNRRPVFAAAVTSLKAVSRAASRNNAPFLRTERCVREAKTLSIGFDVGK